jgi:hypothetical protein
MTTERRPRRASKRSLRALAWTAAGVSLAAPSVALAMAPKPVPPSAQTGHRKVIVVHRTIRRIVYAPAAAGPATSSAPSVHYVYVGGGTVSGGSTTTTTRCSGC